MLGKLHNLLVQHETEARGVLESRVGFHHHDALNSSHATGLIGEVKGVFNCKGLRQGTEVSPRRAAREEQAQKSRSPALDAGERPDAVSIDYGLTVTFIVVVYDGLRP